ncbi:hypothetical protein M422DRAFT_773853 [Sphaerobolus stellatus SS14]|nr:hypothetical protein M422DRAFT_773853 [Sphaerobolus stellatus SS14]
MPSQRRIQTIREKMARLEATKERIREADAVVKDAWQEDKDLVDRLFPVKSAMKRDIERTKSNKYYAARRRWNDVPVSPSKHKQLCLPLHRLLNHILSHVDAGRGNMESIQRRYIQRTMDQWLLGNPPSPLSPPLYLTGAGPEFVHTPLLWPTAHLSHSISPIEICLESYSPAAWGTNLVGQCWAILKQQTNRRFIYSLLFTERNCTLYLVDRSGAVSSRSFNYHEDPDRLCAVVWGISTKRAGDIGFDPTIKIENLKPTLTTKQLLGHTRKAVRYQLHGTVFEFPHIFGRGTICWRAKRMDESDNWYVIKDSWVNRSIPGRGAEGSILRHIQEKGITLGVVQLVLHEEIRCGNRADTVLQNRKITSPSPEQAKLDLVHTRTVMKAYGRTINNFSSQKELVLAFYDAVKAHRQLHQVAGVLHRDISPNNILLNPGGAEGNRGILIDFDIAVRIDDNSEFATKFVGGTYKFMSRNVIMRDGPHTYFDDLESFYYVLRWILGMYTAPRTIRTVPHDSIAFWDRYPAFASISKGGQLAVEELLHIEPWFGQSLRNLADRLRKFFDERHTSKGQELSKLDPEGDYTAYIGEIEQCISEMETEEL